MKISLIEADILTENNLVEHFYGADVVFHFSANADVREEVTTSKRFGTEYYCYVSNIGFMQASECGGSCIFFYRLHLW